MEKAAAAGNAREVASNFAGPVMEKFDLRLRRGPGRAIEKSGRRDTGGAS